MVRMVKPEYIRMWKVPPVNRATTIFTLTVNLSLIDH